MNGLFLRRSRRFVLEPGAGGASPRDVVMVQQEVENLGFVLDEPLVERLATQSTAQLAEVLVELRTTLAALTGAHRQYRPLFPEFPRSVRQVPEYALYQRAVQHYLTLLREHPATPDAPVPLLHGRAPRLIRLGSVAEQVSTAVLLQALAHFQHRGQAALRTFFPKGDAARAWCTPEQRPALPGTLRTQVIAHLRAALVARFATRPPLGRCYLDPALADLKVPLAQRSAAKALRTLVRGSRLPLPDTRFIRLFLWWTNGRERTDIDLSAAFFDGGFGYRDVVSFYNLRHYGGHHSGDIVDAPKGAAEFIDLDLELLRTRGIRFVVTCINSYTRQPYCDLPECFAGWMARDQVNSGEPFEARTVEDRLDLASDQQTCLPFILDLEARQVIWTDIGLGGYPRWNNVANNLSGIALMLRAMSDLATPDLHTLFELHAEARGSEVDDPAEADLRFGPDGDIDPLDLDRIRAEFL